VLGYCTGRGVATAFATCPFIAFLRLLIINDLIIAFNGLPRSRIEVDLLGAFKL